MLFTRNTYNKKFATFEFQRDEKTEGKWAGAEIYLWYHETEKDWRLTEGSYFQAKNNACYMYFESQGEQELLIHLPLIL